MNRRNSHLVCPSLLLVSSILGIALIAAPAVGRSPIGDDEALPRAGWRDARSLLGQTALIHGRVTHVGHTERVHFLDFSRDRTDFKVVIFSEAIESFPHSLDDYVGKLIQVRGPVSLYRGNPQIVVGLPRQIRLIENEPTPWIPPVPKVRLGPNVTIATFNSENLFDADDDPYRNDDSTPPKNRSELEKLARVIREIDADVLALQEVESRGYLERFNQVLLAELGYRHIVHYEGNDGRGIDVCLLSRLPIGAVTSYRHLRFQDAAGGDQRFQRDVLRAEVVPPHGELFEVWVVHLKSNFGGRETAEPIRLAECRKLRELLDKTLTQTPERAIVVCGDFNDTIESSTLKTIQGPQNSPRRLDCFVNQFSHESAVSYNKPPYQSTIDFILTSPAMSRRYIENSYRIRPGSQAETGSDHNPVWAKFRIK